MRRLLFLALAAVTDRALADAMLGDLEEVRQRQARTSAVRATLWFLGAGLGLLVHVFGARMREWRRGAALGRLGTHGLGGDLQQAFRSLRRNRAFASAIVVLLALGIGANTAVFSVVHAVLLRPLPYHDPGRLVFIWGGHETGPDNRHNILTGTHVIEVARHQATLETYAAFKTRDIGLAGAVDLLRPDGSERLRGAHVTPNFFELLGVRAAIGRTFASADTEAQPVVVISHALWQRRFGGDPGIIGHQIAIASGREARAQPPYTVVGVLPDDFRFTYPEETEIYVPMPWSRVEPGRALEYALIARLKDGATAAQASAELTVIAQNVTRSYGLPPEYLASALNRTSMMAEPVADHLVAEVRPGLSVLAAVATLVLLIACVNIGLLMMSRTVDRSGELAVRAALGAGRGRLVRLMLVEGAVVAAAGGTAGIALAYTVQPLVRSLMPPIVPRIDEIGVDPRVLLFAMAITVVSALVCGITSSLVAVRGNLLTGVKRAGITTTADRRLAFFRMAVVGIQVAAVLVLLVGAGLLLHSLWRLQATDLGFRADDVLTLETRLLNPKYRVKGAVATFERQLLSQVRQIPGVQAATVSTAVPMRGVDFYRIIELPNGRSRGGNWRAVDPNYFSILRIPTIAGRVFTTDDNASSKRVVVVSQSMAERLYGREPAVGREVLAHEDKPAEIIGVVGDVRYADPTRPPVPAWYTPRAQDPVELICLLVKPQPGMQEQVAVGLREAVRALDPEQPVEGLTTVGQIVAASAADRRFYAVSTASFASVALVLAIAGLVGVVSRAVTERRRELAIRAALGADARNVLRLMLSYALLPVAFGCLVGILIADATSRMLQPLIFGVTPTDPLTFAAAAGFVLVIAFLATLVPAARALRIPPMTVLKND